MLHTTIRHLTKHVLQISDQVLRTLAKKLAEQLLTWLPFRTNFRFLGLKAIGSFLAYVTLLLDQQWNMTGTTLREDRASHLPWTYLFCEVSLILEID